LPVAAETDGAAHSCVGLALTLAEATAIVSAAFSEDHDRKTFDAAIKRLGDAVDASLGLNRGAGDA
jgi:hypothetical protein